MNYTAAIAVTPQPPTTAHYLFKLQRANDFAVFSLGSIALIIHYHPPASVKTISCSLCKHLSECWIRSSPAPCQVDDPRCCSNTNTSGLMAPYLFDYFRSITRPFCNISFGCFYESLSALPTLQFYFLITTVHQAGFHLERAALCQAYHLIHQRPVRQLAMLHTPQYCPPRAAPLLVTLLR